MCAVVPVAGWTAAPAAFAEGNGGCYSYSDVDTYPDDSTLITWKSRISKKATRVGHPTEGNLSPRGPWLNLR